MQRGWERVVVRYPLIALVAQGRLSQHEAALEVGLSVRQVRRLVKLYALMITGDSTVHPHSFRHA